MIAAAEGFVWVAGGVEGGGMFKEGMTVRQRVAAGFLSSFSLSFAFYNFTEVLALQHVTSWLCNSARTDTANVVMSSQREKP
jgi:hypothetical protein